jgi:hypothetical protein
MMRSLRLTLIAALLCATGAQWVLLQTFAWTKMSWERMGTDGVVGAVIKATDGQHPCRLCLAARKGAADSQKNQPSRNANMRLDFLATTAVVIVRAPAVSWIVDPIRFEASDVSSSVELPPPCRLPA